MSGQLLVAVGSGTSSNSIASSSDDAATWTGRSSAQSAWVDAAWNGSTWCAVATSSRSVCRSPDGTTWTRTTNALPSGANPRRIVWVPWLNSGSGYFVVTDAGGKSYVSADGLTWTGGSSGLAARGWSVIAFSGSIIVIGDYGNSQTIATSTDGLAWTEQTATMSDSVVGDIVWGAGKFVLVGWVGQQGYISTSTNGTSWTDTGTTIGASCGGTAAMVFANSKFLAVCAGHSGSTATPTVFYSSDGTSWTQGGEVDGTSFSMATANRPWPLAYNGATWATLDSGSGSRLSTNDGSSWSGGGSFPATTVGLATAIVATFTSFTPPGDGHGPAAPWPAPTRVPLPVLDAEQLVVTAVDPLAAWLAGNGKAFRADLITITLRDGSTVYRWTTSDIPLTYGGHIYGAFGTGAPQVKRHGYTRRLLPAIDTFDLTLEGQGGGAFGGGFTIGGKGLPQLGLEGYFDGARVRIDHAIMPVPNDFSLGLMPGFFYGLVAGVDPLGPTLRLRCKSDVETLSILLPRFQARAQCGNAVYDSNCALSAATFAISGTASGSPSESYVQSSTAGIVAKASGYFNLGVLRFTSGALSGTSRAVATSTLASGVTTFALAMPFPSAAAAGDTFAVYPGCDGSLDSCITKFSNTAQYRGFPHNPHPEAGA